MFELNELAFRRNERATLSCSRRQSSGEKLFINYDETNHSGKTLIESDNITQKRRGSLDFNSNLRSSSESKSKLSPKQLNFNFKSMSSSRGNKTETQLKLLLFAAIVLILHHQTLTNNFVHGQQVEAKNLPTVLVRGFLNYRTTVDGTVLLFTPDAGGSVSGQSTQSTSSNLNTLVQSISASSRATAIEPTSLSGQRDGDPIVAGSTLLAMQPISGSEPTPELAEGRQLAGAGRGAPTPEAGQTDNGWTHISTPPLKTAQHKATTFMNQPELATGMTAEASVLLASPVRPTARQQEPMVMDEPRVEARGQTPSVQADDILPGQTGSNLKPETVEGSTTTTPSSGSVSRAVRPKRPSLGFTGQGLRKPQGLQASSSPAAGLTGPNTINGIRRPGLSAGGGTTPTPSSSNGPAQQASTPSPSSTAFQNRLTNASARLRNKLRRPQQHGNSSLGAAGPQTTGIASAFQPAESPSLFDQSGALADLGGSQSQSVGSFQSPQETALQVRMGDIVAPENRDQAPSANSATSPAVGSDEVLSILASSEPQVGGDENPQSKLQSRSGEQLPKSKPEPQLLSGGLVQSGSLDSSAPMTLDGFFSDQPQLSGIDSASSSMSAPGEASELHAKHQGPKDGPTQVLKMRNNNDKLNGWMDQHNNKYIPRPANHHEQAQGHLSQQLANNPNLISPSFSLSLAPVSASQQFKQPTQALASVGNFDSSNLKPTVGSDDVAAGSEMLISKNSSSITSAGEEGDQAIQLQTITKTYSTIMTSYRTRLVPLNVKSSTSIYTITENYVITKLLTAFQTMPVGEFILPELMQSKSPFEMFNENVETDKSREPQQQPAAPSTGSNVAPSEPQISQEQPISLDTSGSKKSANDWLHDFSNSNSNENQQQNLQQQQKQSLAALLEQQAQEASLAGFPSSLNALGLSGEPLDQLASSLDPASLFADGAINIPDLNNPLVLAAAIQNPQLAAVILAAQQLQLKQRQNKLNNLANQAANQLIQPQQQQQLQPSYSTSFSTVIKPSVNTIRDTMYTTRLVSFKDGRTVRTRTVSEPGQVIEQVVTTMATEIIPITITIKPTGVLAMPSTAIASLSGSAQDNQATINNALIATQLAGLLARRQQQVLQPSQNPFNNANSNQLAALQQLLANQQRTGNNNNQQQQVAKQFQPNFQQMLQSMQNQQAQQNQQQQQPSTSPSSLSPASNQEQPGNKVEKKDSSSMPNNQAQITPPLTNPLAPITTTLTNLQVRTYTVHNAFKTIYRTITSTQLITSTIFPGGSGPRSTQVPSLG